MSDKPTVAMPEYHHVLDRIYEHLSSLADFPCTKMCGKSVQFYDNDQGKWFQIVVRSYDET